MRNLIEKWKQEESAVFEGWDFSYLKGRMTEEKPPWNYNAMAKRLVRKSRSVLDMGTGGGEIFSSFAPLPRDAVATEGYVPNVAMARKKLGTLGAKVIDVSKLGLKLPFPDSRFELVLNRHEAFDAKEVFGVLQHGGTFLTQQVGSGNLKDLAKAFSRKCRYREWNAKSAARDLRNAGFSIKDKREFRGKAKFMDVGAVVYFLKAIPWIVPGFSVERNMEHLEKLQNRLRNGHELIFTQTRFLVLATKT